MRTLVTVDRGVMSGQCKGALVRVQVRYTAIFFGWLPAQWSGLQIGLFTPTKTDTGYCCRGFYARLLPGISGAVTQWPAWYRRAWRAMSFGQRHAG